MTMPQIVNLNEQIFNYDNQINNLSTTIHTDITNYNNSDNKLRL